MTDAVALMRAVLGPATGEEEARAVLNLALSRDIDPLHWAATRHHLDPFLVMSRAAKWAGLAFRHDVPAIAAAENAPRLDRLAEIRIISHDDGQDALAYAAPDFFGVLRLKRAMEQNPTLAQRLCLVPRQALRDNLALLAGEALIDASRQTMVRYWPYAAAQLDLTTPVRWAFAVLLLALAIAVLAAPFLGHPALTSIWFVAMAIPTLLRLAALATPLQSRRRPSPIDDRDLPRYSILVPLRDEANMVPQLCDALRKLDYPGELQEILFVVESRSPETVAAVRRYLDDARFGLIVVPDAQPRTKPKALNFALPFCTGEFVVVYDAEDRPAPDQLRRIVEQFRSQPGVECIQARLVIDNGRAGFLPSLFTGEYAGLFAVLLPALVRWGAVMPLGGTSNHFRLAALRDLGGWDAFNVTEDADLGVRLARSNLRTSTSVTMTLEEAPVALRPWLGQRTRWLKGWMQTFVVHNRRPVVLLAHLGLANFLIFELTIIGMLLAPLLHLALLPIAAWMVIDGFHAGPTPWTIACLSALAIGFGVAIITNLLGLARTGQHRFMRHQALLPLYWLLIAWAACLALRDFVHRPFHWFKSPHTAHAPPRSPDHTQPAAMPAE